MTGRKPGLVRRPIPGTTWPAWLLLALVALALAPFAIWFALAVFRRTSRPLRDHLVAGTLYGLSLVIAHEALWAAAGSSLGHHPPDGAVNLAERFDSPLHELILHGYTAGIAMMIGLGVGVSAALLAVVANGVRSLRARRHGSWPHQDGG